MQFSFGLTFWGMLCYWNRESIFFKELHGTNFLFKLLLCFSFGLANWGMFSRWLLWRKCDFIFLKLQGSTFPILIVAGSYGKSHYSTESGWVGFHVRLLSSSKPVSRHCKISLLSSRWHPLPNLVCIYTKPVNSCFIQKNMPLESKGWRGNW
jgi:hypothetical protein